MTSAASADDRPEITLSIIDALEDPNLLGGLPAFKDLSSWYSWLVFLKAAYGLPLDRKEVDVFKKHTDRSKYDPPPGGFAESFCRVGRQAGKSRVAGTIAAYEAIKARPEPDGTELYATLVAQNKAGSIRGLFGYAKAPFETVPLLATSGGTDRADSLQVRPGITLGAYPCKPAAVRGIRSVVGVVDELAFFIATDERPTDKEMLRALRPTMATTGGKLFGISSPYFNVGALAELDEHYYGKDDSTTLMWKATAPEMNPTLTADYIERMKRDDPEAYIAEVLGEFRTGASTLFDPAALAACVMDERRELPPQAGVRYFAFTDPSGGSKDAFGLAIGHVANGKAIVDYVRRWKAPFNPTDVVADIAKVLRHYRTSTVVGDRYGGEWPPEAFRKKGIRYRHSELDRSQLYLEMLPRVNAEQVLLLDDEVSLKELRGLERRRGTGGRDRVDHRRGEHDDVANCVAGVLSLLRTGGQDPRKHFRVIR